MADRAGATSNRDMAEREGFEPSIGVTYTHFPGVLLRPLGHLSVEATHPATPNARVRRYRCSLPGLAEFTAYRRLGTRWATTGSRMLAELMP